RWASLTLRFPSESVRVVHDEWRAAPSAVLAGLSPHCVQGLMLLVAAPLRPTHEREWLAVLGFNHFAEHGASLRWFVPDELRCPGFDGGSIPLRGWSSEWQVRTTVAPSSGGTRPSCGREPCGWCTRRSLRAASG